MGQEFFINSQELEDKVRSLLPSQGGAGAGFDLSASTQIIPIIDLTESAEGGSVRQDLQTSLSLISVTSFSVTGATSTLVTNTGYFRVFGTTTQRSNSSIDVGSSFSLTDGTTTKIIYSFQSPAGLVNGPYFESYDFIVFLQAGDSLTCTSTANAFAKGVTRQIADISGDLVNP